MSQELPARAVILLHNNGQVIEHAGELEEFHVPAMAALVAAMTSAGKSLGALTNDKPIPATRFHCESDEIGLYAVAIDEDYWLATLFDQPLNPGQFRMKVRRYGDTLVRMAFGVENQVWEKSVATDSGPAPAPSLKPTGAINAGASSAPAAKTTSGLFENITDDEIDSLFLGGSS